MAASSKKPITDVAKPGDTPVHATSRPVIVKRDAFMQDPMMAPAADESQPKSADKPSEAPAIAPTAKKVIKPLEEESELDAESAPKTESEKPEPTNTKSEEAPDTSKDSVSDNAVVDAVLDQVNNPATTAAVDKETQERQALVTKLVQEKKYFVPLAAAQHQRNNKIAIIVLAAFLPLLVGVVLAMDVGVIETGVSLPFDLIK